MTAGQKQVLVLKLPGVNHGLHPLALLHLKDVDNVGALGGLAALGDLVALLAVDLAGVGEEEEVVVGGGGEHVHHAVLLPGGDALLAHAALGLGRILADRGTLDTVDFFFLRVAAHPFFSFASVFSDSPRRRLIS